jgi:hypothetical protein
MAMSFHLLVRSSLKSQVPENCTARRSALTLALDLKLFQSLLHHSKGDGNAEHFAVIDPLDFNSPNASMSLAQSSLMSAKIGESLHSIEGACTSEVTERSGPRSAAP